MPGWYIHMETATLVAKRLQAADLPPDAKITPLDAQGLGELAHTWRNYLAAGAIGPDIFFLLPEFKGDKGNVLLTVTNWVLTVWDKLDSEFVSKWETWAQPAIDGVGDVLNQATGVLAHKAVVGREVNLPRLTEVVRPHPQRGTVGHLGTVTRTLGGFAVVPGGSAPLRLNTHLMKPGTTPVPPFGRGKVQTTTMSPARAVVKALHAADFTAGAIARAVSTSSGDGNLLRFEEVRNGVVVGGYSIIVQG